MLGLFQTKTSVKRQYNQSTNMLSPLLWEMRAGGTGHSFHWAGGLDRPHLPRLPPAGPSARATLVPASQPAAAPLPGHWPLPLRCPPSRTRGRRPALDPGAQQCPGPLLSAVRAHSVPASHLLTRRRTLPPSTRPQVSATRPPSPGPPLPIPAPRRSPSAQVLCRPPHAHYL